MDGKGVEAVIEILSKLALIHIVRQAGVARGDHPHIHVDLLDPAHRTDAALLKHPEQLGLEARSISEISSRKRVPPAAASKSPSLPPFFAPVKAPST